MQTWEYSPAYSIRTYSFIFPVFIFGDLLKRFGFSSITIFHIVRSTFGMFTAYTQSKFVHSLQKEFGITTALLTAMFILCSAGIFFSSTSFLPSAVTMNLVTMACSSWLDKRFLVSIFWGSVAVLWSGWPFVALLFAPLGLFMVVDSALDKSMATLMASFWSVSSLLLSGFVIAAVVCVPTVLLDRHFYQKW